MGKKFNRNKGEKSQNSNRAKKKKQRIKEQKSQSVNVGIPVCPFEFDVKEQAGYMEVSKLLETPFCHSPVYFFEKNIKEKDRDRKFYLNQFCLTCFLYF